jgi:hypothetical protein
MRNVIFCVVCIVCVGLVGCGNVYLQGDALTATQNSALDAYQAVQRGAADPATPAWENAYLQENFKQWRSYVRSAVKDANWGPKLPGESAPASQPSSGI